MRRRLSRPQSSIFDDNSRFRVVVAGRRFGKTYLAIVELLRMAWGSGRDVWYVGPIYRQMKDTVWRELKRYTHPYTIKLNEQDLSIDLKWGARIALRSASNYDSLRGPGLNGLVCDEFADIQKEAWTEVLRPMLSDRGGKALFIGTPKGRNHFYELYQRAKDRTEDWAAFSYTTLEGGNVPREEIEAARRDLDERTFRQEYEASFENFAGVVYYAFDSKVNVRPTKYNPRLSLMWSLDFNINPMCSVICQRDGEGTIHVLEELVLPQSNTFEACGEFLKRSEKYLSPTSQVNLYVYGDPAGNQGHSSATRTDWQIVREFFGRYTHCFKVGYKIHEHDAHPPVKDRITCVNSRLRSYDGERHLFIDPKCKELIKDFEQVTWKEDAAGNLLSELNKRDPLRTHVSDALGYLVYREFPMRPIMGEKSGYLGVH